MHAKRGNNVKRLLLLGVAALGIGGPVLAHGGPSSALVEANLTTKVTGKLDKGARIQVDVRFSRAGQPIGTCRCRVLLYAGQPSARVAPLQDFMMGDLDVGAGEFKLNIPQRGDYTLVIDGRPTSYGLFDAFKMRYALQAGSP